jgi:hypothetical protein
VVSFPEKENVLFEEGDHTISYLSSATRASNKTLTRDLSVGFMISITISIDFVTDIFNPYIGMDSPLSAFKGINLRLTV